MWKDNSKNAILKRIRQAKKRKSSENGTPHQPTPKSIHHSLPTWEEDNLSRFINQAHDAAADVTNIDCLTDLPEKISGYLREHRLEQEIWLTELPEWLSLDWGEITLHTGALDRGVAVCVSQGNMGIAETGTLVLFSSAAAPTTHNFLCDHHIVLLNSSDVVKNLEAVWLKVREEKILPRTVNLITGPSRTADIEQTMHLGAHGPKFLTVILVD